MVCWYVERTGSCPRIAKWGSCKWCVLSDETSWWKQVETRLDLGGARSACPWVQSVSVRELPCDNQSAAVDVEMSIAYIEQIQLRIELWFSKHRSWPPTVRVRQIIHHSHVDNLGYLSDAFYNALAWQAKKQTLTDALVVLRAFLHSPPTAPAMSADELLSKWYHHHPECKCLFSRSLPYDFHTLRSMPYQKRRSELDKVACDIALNEDKAEMAAQVRRTTTLGWADRGCTPSLFGTTLQDQWFAPEFLLALQAAESTQDNTIKSAAIHNLVTEESDGVYSFPMLSTSFCDSLVAELRSYESSGLPKPRPNSMNNYGLILNDIGMERFFDEMLRRFVQPVASVLLARWGGNTLDHHHTFLVEYREGQDVSLDMHEDDADVTLNVNLLDGFEGSGLCFCGYQRNPNHRTHSLTYMHRRGVGVLHAGSRRHGALPLSSGERVNLIMWSRSSQYRSNGLHLRDRKGPADTLTPDLICLSRAHDDDHDSHASRARQLASATVDDIVQSKRSEVGT